MSVSTAGPCTSCGAPDGGHVSVVNHVESFPTALAATRAAVDDLGGTRLVPAGPAPH